MTRTQMRLTIGRNEGTLTTKFVGYEDDRAVYRYTVANAEGVELDRDEDLQLPQENHDARKAMESLISFLGAAAEGYEYEMRGGESENTTLFNEATAEWAYGVSDELSMAGLELSEGQGL